jgi:hypothetical protein
MNDLCPDCLRNPDLGTASRARWVGPDGNGYCSMHFVQRFGHAEKLVKINGYEAPKRVKAPAPRRGAASGRSQGS